jgi:hypothetical protein
MKGLTMAKLPFSPRCSRPLLSLNAMAVVAGIWLRGISTTRAAIVVSGSFGPNGDVGFVNSSPDLSISFGQDGQGSIYQLDGFVNVAGENLNNTGSGFGTSADLSYGAPTGVSYQFSAAQPTADQLLLSYQFKNTSGAVLPGFQFLSFVDGDIGPNFADESAIAAGIRGTGGIGSSATSFQVGDPSSSTLFTNLLFGTLDNTNAFPPPASGDVSTGLGFTFGDLAPGQSVGFEILLSDDGSTLGLFALTQTDPVFITDTLTVSGSIVSVPEPTMAGVIALACLPLLVQRHRRAKATAGAVHE